MIRATIVGGSGYTGGELLRILTGHPEIEVGQVTSRSHLGEYVYQVHPNLRKQSTLKFSDPELLKPTDILFLALPHGQAQHKIEKLAGVAPVIIDLSADFRLHDPKDYETWYGSPHAAPAWLDKFIYGLPELHREELRGAHYASGVGCNATASNLALLPLVKASLLDMEKQVIIEIKVGSSGAAPRATPARTTPNGPA
jgi:N-acetyl-gamma-glutamyl-phosphate/LysW-gamma-L-alpha-aminoadipyl-6-phosphate reductase